MSSRQLCSLMVSLAALSSFGHSQHVVASEQSAVDFERDIRPILTDSCAGCHGGVHKHGGFSVLGPAALQAATDSGLAAVVPEDADGSELVRRISSDDLDERMPPEGHDPLTATQIDLLRRWINDGAVWPQHWSWAPIEAVHATRPFDSATIDALVLERLNAAGLQMSAAADPATLIRRLSLDLTGLLPEAEEVQAFVAGPDDVGYAKLVDRLLDSEHFGERWGRHWLDEARYADSEGYEKDSPKSDAYQFRDWVIDAINNDMPFDQFTVRQIAGDLLPDASSSDLVATKFHLQTQFNLEGGVDAEEDRTKRVIDQINTVGTVWLGTSIGCCQCHDHPYDPLSQQDFYAFYAFFNNTDLAAMLPNPDAPDAKKKITEREKRWQKLAELLEQQVDNKNLSNAVQAQLTQLRKYDNSSGFIRYLRERREDRRSTFAFHRGDFLQPDLEGGAVPASTPRLLPPLQPRGATADRLDLARWLVSESNPLVARVTVNKVWMHLFGKPLVDQPQDFGSRGGTASHPAVLDGLAHWFIHEGGWSRKKLIRLIVMSDTYRQSSVVDDNTMQVDPGNRLLSRQNRFRVEAEIVRDIALQASGLLSDRVGGPSVFPPLPAIIAQQTYANSNKYRVSTGADRYRRGIYTFFRRTAIDPNLLTFDCPDSSMTRPQRDRSNNPLQALALLHNEVFHEASQHFAARILQSGAAGDDERFRNAFLIALSRPPTGQELATLSEMLSMSRAWYRDAQDMAVELVGPHAADGHDVAEQAAWVATLRVILNLDEFVTRS